MSQTVHLAVPPPAHLAQPRLPTAQNARLHFLLDQQSRKERSTPAKKKEAEGLAQMARILSILKLGAQVKLAAA